MINFPLRTAQPRQQALPPIPQGQNVSSIPLPPGVDLELLQRLLASRQQDFPGLGGPGGLSMLAGFGGFGGPGQQQQPMTRTGYTSGIPGGFGRMVGGV